MSPEKALNSTTALRLRGADTPITGPQYLHNVAGVRRKVEGIAESSKNRPGLVERRKRWARVVGVLRREMMRNPENLSPKEFDYLIGFMIAHFEDQAEIDDLTKLDTRRAAIRKGEEIIAQAERTGSPVTMAIVDLDRFKSVNDRYGHFAGNAVLRETARVLRGRLGEATGRYGGEEIVKFYPATNSKNGVEAIERQRRTMARTIHGRVKKRGYDIDHALTMSVGMATYYPNREEDLLFFGDDQRDTHDIDPDSEAFEFLQQVRASIRRNNIMSYFIDKADKALYAAKILGRDRTVFNMDQQDGDDLLVDLRSGDIFVHDVEIKQGKPIATYDKIKV